MKLLILGVTGMLGHAIYCHFFSNPEYTVYGTLRNLAGYRYFPQDSHSQLLSNVDVLDHDVLIDVFLRVRPDVVINCIGLIKQLAQSNDPLQALPINAMLPHRLNHLCKLGNARLVHFSTDCVFSGNKGMYVESDVSDAIDLYGKSKFIGEVQDSTVAVTLRTSIIGHELASSNALVEWFLSQSGQVKGYRKAVFSGLPTVEMARIVEQYVLANPELWGLYHLSAEPIDKMSLLKLVAKEYGKNVDIIPDDAVRIDRSLDSSRFKDATGYTPPNWPDLIRLMNESQNSTKYRLGCHV